LLERNAIMPRYVLFITAAVLLAGVARAEEKPTLDQLKKAYDDALVQLKDAQNSKNDLAKENEKLVKLADDLKKQLASAQAENEKLKRELSDTDRKTFSLRAYQAAWQSFLRAYPDLMVRWKLFLSEDVLAVPQDPRPLVDPSWPLFDSTGEPARG
jgi:septal ring factor EnvC (AmiA/AmiB activator)